MRTIHLALLLLLPLAACSKPEAETEAPKSAPLAVPAPQTAPVADASALYRQGGCVACHGQRGEGGMLGPTLDGLSAHWNREDLARFFADPESFVASVPRIAEQKSKYAMAMPPTPGLSEGERQTLADWLLQR